MKRLLSLFFLQFMPLLSNGANIHQTSQSIWKFRSPSVGTHPKVKLACKYYFLYSCSGNHEQSTSYPLDFNEPGLARQKLETYLAHGKNEEYDKKLDQMHRERCDSEDGNVSIEDGSFITVISDGIHFAPINKEQQYMIMINSKGEILLPPFKRIEGQSYCLTDPPVNIEGEAKVIISPRCHLNLVENCPARSLKSLRQENQELEKSISNKSSR